MIIKLKEKEDKRKNQEKDSQGSLFSILSKNFPQNFKVHSDLIICLKIKLEKKIKN